MKSENLLATFQNARMIVFTSKDIERLTSKGIAYTSLYISRLVKKNKLVRVEKGKYCLSNADIYEIASNIIFPSYVSLFASFNLYGLTTQGQIMTIDVMTANRHKRINFRGYSIRFITLTRKRLFGFQRINNTAIIAALPEKAIVDALYLGNPNEVYVFEALKAGLSKDVLNEDRLIDFAKKMQSKKTLEKLKLLIAEIKRG
ncbi:type IV toxin-antitoxin system AbiEi family antitoxin domain-containing protein [Candidatus Parvarchaeota archaeon]|nr:type IV toxin-antitoxin system AbiEi family antitoxin domain-containing protein [Candidatus Parvarchaeota archaeon]